MRTLLFFLAMVAFTACKKEKNNAEKAVENTTVVEQESPQWEVLFDGKTFKGWHVYLTDSISDEWAIEDGALFLTLKKIVPKVVKILYPIKNIPISSYL